VPSYKNIELKREFAAVNVRVGVPGGSLSTARQSWPLAASKL